MYTRRNFVKLAAGLVPAFAAWAKIEAVYHGVILGAQSYSFRDRSLDEAIEAMREIGIGEVELWMGHVEPKGGRGGQSDETLRQWRLSAPDSFFQDVARKIRGAGIDLFAYNYSFRDNFTDQEIERGFQMARAMGVKVITASSTVSTAKRVAPFADKYKIVAAMHGHSNLKDPNEFARPESFETAMSYSRYIGTNLDIGHFFAAGFDPVAFIQKHHARIPCIHVKDRKRDQGENMPFGQGDTPIRECLQLIRKNHYRIAANIEYEYKGADTVAEVKKCLEFCKAALA